MSGSMLENSHSSPLLVHGSVFLSFRYSTVDRRLAILTLPPGDFFRRQTFAAIQRQKKTPFFFIFFLAGEGITAQGAVTISP